MENSSKPGRVGERQRDRARQIESGQGVVVVLLLKQISASLVYSTTRVCNVRFVFEISCTMHDAYHPSPLHPRGAPLEGNKVSASIRSCVVGIHLRARQIFVCGLWVHGKYTASETERERESPGNILGHTTHTYVCVFAWKLLCNVDIYLAIGMLGVNMKSTAQLSGTSSLCQHIMPAAFVCFLPMQSIAFEINEV